ncbi:11964_t:CDS:1, partial [Funneliformis geosporum]
MKQNWKAMPIEFGRSPINIQKHHLAVDWYNWIVLYSLPLLHNYLLI